MNSKYCTSCKHFDIDIPNNNPCIYCYNGSQFLAKVFEEMRDMTEEENDAYINMIRKKSINTGINVFELIKEEN